MYLVSISLTQVKVSPFSRLLSLESLFPPSSVSRYVTTLSVWVELFSRTFDPSIEGLVQASSILNKVAGEEKLVAEKNVNNL